MFLALSAIEPSVFQMSQDTPCMIMKRTVVTPTNSPKRPWNVKGFTRLIKLIGNFSA